MGRFKTNRSCYMQDADQAYFLYTANDDLGALTSNGNLHFVYSVGVFDYITDLGVAVTVTLYSSYEYLLMRTEKLVFL